MGAWEKGRMCSAPEEQNIGRGRQETAKKIQYNYNKLNKHQDV
jgi:hypothetical protein